jgi:hypothetical protein
MLHAGFLVPLLLSPSLALAQEPRAGAHVPGARNTEHSTLAQNEDSLVASLFEGFVLEPDGTPAVGSIVVSSAGGKAVTDPSGSFRLEVSVPLDAESVQLTAVGQGSKSRVASSSVALSGTPRSVWVGALLLSSGSCTPSWMPEFGGQSGVNGEVNALSVFDDGNGPALYAGGRFTNAGGVSANTVAKWNGSSWSALGSGTNGHVNALTVFDDGGGPALYAGGEFTTAGGVAANYVAKWNGSSWSPLGSGMNARFYALSVFDDGSGPALWGGGLFTTAGGAAANHLAEWGCLDTSPPVLSFPTSIVVMDRLADGFGETVTFLVMASDDRDPSPTLLCVPPSGSAFPPGTTVVQCTATDASGNQATGQFPVTVRPKARLR